MADKVRIIPYVRGPFPALEASVNFYVQQELMKLERTIKSLIEYIDKLEARLKVLEGP